MKINRSILIISLLFILVVSFPFGIKYDWQSGKVVCQEKLAFAAPKIYKKIARQMEKRKKSFKIKCQNTASVKKLIKKINGGSQSEFYKYVYEVIMSADNANNTDDGEYLYGLIRDMTCYYSQSDKNLLVNVKYFETKKQTKAVNSYIKSLAAAINKEGKNTLDKIDLAHGYIIDRVKYSPNASSPYSGLIKKKGNCNSYSLIFYKLLKKLKIGVKFISGKAKDEGKWELHAWNLVKLGGKWYTIDLTFDDQDDEYVYMDYYLIGENKAKKDHKRDKMFNKVSFKKKYKLSNTNYPTTNSTDTVKTA